MTLYDNLKAKGLVGFMNDTDITSENYKEILMNEWKHFNENSWKKPNECPKDDKNYLVCWLQSNGKYSSWHRAYYLEWEKHFFSLENINSHPLHVDIYLEVPEIDIE